MAGTLVTDGLVACWRASDWSSGTTWTDYIANKVITFSSAPSSKTSDGIELTTSITFASATLQSLGVSYPCSFEWYGRVDGTWSSSAPGNVFGIGSSQGTWNSCVECYANTTSSAGISLDLNASRSIVSSLQDEGIMYQILFTVNSSGTTTLYVNSSTAKGTSTNSLGTCNKYYLSNDEGSGRFYGAINRMSLWNTCLSDDEITTLFGDGVVTTTYTVNTSITHGTLTSPTEATMTVTEGNDLTLTFQGDVGYTFSSMTVNGVSVTPTETIVTPSSDDLEVTYSTNYSIYNSNELEYAFDSDTSNCFWTNEAQVAGKYVLINFNKNINLSAFSTTTTGSSTDYIISGTSLQVSSDNGTTWTTVGTFDGNATDTFSDLNQNNINAIRIYWNGDTNYWLYINTITMTYTEVASEDESYSVCSYTISNVTGDKEVIIIFSDSNAAYYVKVNGNWKKIIKIYRKIAYHWVEWDYNLESTRNYVYKGTV